MRSLRIRTFTMLCFFFILLLPWIFFVTAHFMETKTLSFEQGRSQNETLQRNISEMTRRIESDTDQWTDPVWQNQLYSALREAKMDVLIQSAEDREIYRSNPDRRGTNLSTERFSVIEDGQSLGRVILYLPKSNQFQVMSAFVGSAACDLCCRHGNEAIRSQTTREDGKCAEDKLQQGIGMFGYPCPGSPKSLKSAMDSMLWSRDLSSPIENRLNWKRNADSSLRLLHMIYGHRCSLCEVT